MRLLEIMNSPWMIIPEKLREIRAIYETHMKGEKIDLKSIQVVSRMPDGDAERGYRIEDGIAVIDVRDVLSKNITFFSYLFGGSSMRAIGEAFDRAMEDPQVHAVILAIDSPGGTVDGTEELAAKIMSGRGEKPIAAWADGTMASAAYWIGAAAEKVYIAGDTTVVGSIGVVATHVDYSEQERAMGERWTEITAGRYKRIASIHKPLSDEGRAYIQDQVDSIYATFVESVAALRGRSVEEVLEAADGRIYIGRKAVDAGLADGVSGLNELITRMKEEWTMTKDEIRAKFPDLYQSIHDEGRSVGVVEGAEQGKKDGVAEGRKIGAEEERQRIKDVRAQLMPGHEALIEEMVADGKTTGADAALRVLAQEKARLAAAAEALKASAVAPVPPVAEPAAKADEETFEAAVDRLIAEGMSRGKAMVKVAHEKPELHQDYIARINKRAE